MKPILSILLIAGLFGCSSSPDEIFVPTNTDNAQTAASIAYVKSRFASAKQIEVIALWPGPPSNEPHEVFHGFEITGRGLVTSSSDISDLGRSLINGMSNASPLPAMCFNPHHALVIRDEDSVFEVVVCFECLQGYFKESGRRTDFLTSSIPERTWSRVFSKAGAAIQKNSPNRTSAPAVQNNRDSS